VANTLKWFRNAAGLLANEARGKRCDIDGQAEGRMSGSE
jgi:hypothetical protein